MAAPRNTLNVGFGVASLYGTWQTALRLADNVDVRALAVRAGNQASLVLVSDTMNNQVPASLSLRSAVAQAVGLTADAVGIFSTQNHGVPVFGALPEWNVAAAEEVFIRAARAAMADLQPAEMAVVAARPAQPLALCRRYSLPEVGAFTFWFGHRIDAATGRADVTSLLKEALESLALGNPESVRCQCLADENAQLAGGNVRSNGRLSTASVPQGWIPPVPSPAFLPPAEDELIQALLFRDLAGRPLGSVLRFAAHLVTANQAGAGWHSGDYPAYARRAMEKWFGGTCVFLAGPCGDQCPPVDRKSLALAERIGLRVAEPVLQAMSSAGWHREGPVRVSSPSVKLRVRSDYPASLAAAQTARAAIVVSIREAVAAHKPLAIIKKLAEQHEFLGYAGGSHQLWTGLKLEGMAGRSIEHPLFILRIGAAVLVGLPGEPFGGYSRRLRAETLGDRLLVAEEANGYLCYFPTDAENRQGGYGLANSLFEPGAEETLVSAARAGITRVETKRTFFS